MFARRPRVMDVERLAVFDMIQTPRQNSLVEGRWGRRWVAGEERKRTENDQMKRKCEKIEDIEDRNRDKGGEEKARKKKVGKM